MWLRAVFIALALATPVCAQERITPETFLEAVVGKTISFHMYDTGELVGVEEFLRPDLSVWRPRGGACTYGKVTVEDGKLCFLYQDIRDDPVCWFTFLNDGRLMVRHDRLFDSEVQVVLKITEDSLGCPEDVTS